jgi:hypothetical protein
MNQEKKTFNANWTQINAWMKHKLKVKIHSDGTKSAQQMYLKVKIHCVNNVYVRYLESHGLFDKVSKKIFVIFE